MTMKVEILQSRASITMDGEGAGGDPLMLQRRAEMRDAYTQLLREHPALPPEIRDFQVLLETCSLPLKCFIPG